jgi:hypothetical protein
VSTSGGRVVATTTGGHVREVGPARAGGGGVGRRCHRVRGGGVSRGRDNDPAGLFHNTRLGQGRLFLVLVVQKNGSEN